MIDTRTSYQAHGRDSTLVWAHYLSMTETRSSYPSVRQGINTDHDLSCMLLSSQARGLKLTQMKHFHVAVSILHDWDKASRLRTCTCTAANGLACLVLIGASYRCNENMAWELAFCQSCRQDQSSVNFPQRVTVYIDAKADTLGEHF